MFATKGEAGRALLAGVISWATRSRLSEMVKLAASLRNYQKTIKNTLDSGVTNGRVEATNTHIQNLITDSWLRELLGGVTTLPKPPQVYQQMTAVTADPNYDIDDLIAVIRSDLATSTEVLPLVNSSFFGLPTRVGSVKQAVTLLGMTILQALAVTGGVFATGPVLPVGLDGAQLSNHGLLVATAARQLAQAESWPSHAVTDIFMAGLLHQIGLPVLATANPEQWQAARDAPPADDIWAEHNTYIAHFGCAPTRASAYLLGLWGFPDPVVQAIANQPADPVDPASTPAGLLLTYARQAASNQSASFQTADKSYLNAARGARWQTVLHESGIIQGE